MSEENTEGINPEYVAKLEEQVKTAGDLIDELRKQLDAGRRTGSLPEQPAGALSAIESALALIDPKGIGAPEPGSPGYMIEVVKTLRSALDAEVEVPPAPPEESAE